MMTVGTGMREGLHSKDKSQILIPVYETNCVHIKQR